MNTKTLMMPVVLAVFLLSGCAHYDPIAIEQLSQKNQRVEELSTAVCEDFYAGARAFGEGPERAYAWLGRAREIEDANVVMRKQGAVCYTAEARDMTDEQEDRIMEAFKRTWRNAEEVVK